MRQSDEQWHGIGNKNDHTYADPCEIRMGAHRCMIDAQRDWENQRSSDPSRDLIGNSVAQSALFEKETLENSNLFQIKTT